MADDRIKILEERLTRLEAALSQRPAAGGTGFTPPGGAVVDPAPSPWPTWPIHQRLPPPIVDMAPWWGRPWGYQRWPHPIVDPGPFPTPVVDPGPFPMPVVDPGPFPNPVVDPAPGGGVVRQQAINAATLGRIGHVGDPAPIDVSRFTLSQLESTLHSINAEKARLSSMETMINQQLQKLKKEEG